MQEIRIGMREYGAKIGNGNPRFRFSFARHHSVSGKILGCYLYNGEIALASLWGLFEASRHALKVLPLFAYMEVCDEIHTCFS